MPRLRKRHVWLMAGTAVVALTAGLVVPTAYARIRLGIESPRVGLLTIDPHGNVGPWPSMLTGIGHQVGNYLQQPICVPSAVLVADRATMDLTVGVH